MTRGSSEYKPNADCDEIKEIARTFVLQIDSGVGFASGITKPFVFAAAD